MEKDWALYWIFVKNKRFSLGYCGNDFCGITPCNKWNSRDQFLFSSMFNRQFEICSTIIVYWEIDIHIWTCIRRIRADNDRSCHIWSQSVWLHSNILFQNMNCCGCLKFKWNCMVFIEHFIVWENCASNHLPNMDVPNMSTITMLLCMVVHVHGWRWSPWIKMFDSLHKNIVLLKYCSSVCPIHHN